METMSHDPSANFGQRIKAANGFYKKNLFKQVCFIRWPLLSVGKYFFIFKLTSFIICFHSFFPNSLSSQVKLGIEVLVEKQLPLLEGKRVGLITNPTGVTSDLT
jgi:hypothetical protein